MQSHVPELLRWRVTDCTACTSMILPMYAASQKAAMHAA